jgi:hypothetical protein
MYTKVDVQVPRSELRALFQALKIELKAQEGFLDRVVLWEAKYRLGSQIVQYKLSNGWVLAIAHRWRDYRQQWSTPDPKAVLIDDVKLYS